MKQIRKKKNKDKLVQWDAGGGGDESIRSIKKTYKSILHEGQQMLAQFIRQAKILLPTHLSISQLTYRHITRATYMYIYIVSAREQPCFKEYLSIPHIAKRFS